MSTEFQTDYNHSISASLDSITRINRVLSDPSFTENQAEGISLIEADRVYVATNQSDPIFAASASAAGLDFSAELNALESAINSYKLGGGGV